MPDEMTADVWAEEPGIRVKARPWGDGVILTIYDIDGSRSFQASITGHRWRRMLAMLPPNAISAVCNGVPGASGGGKTGGSTIVMTRLGNRPGASGGGGTSELLAMASAFELIPLNPLARPGTVRELKVQRRHTDPEAWAIVNEGHVLSRDGWWLIEPSPSRRDDEYLASCRWPSAQEAIAFAREHMRHHPTGYLKDQCQCK